MLTNHHGIEFESPIPEEWIVKRPDPTTSAAWWEAWHQLEPLELSKPAAELLAEVRGEEPYDFE